MDQIKSVLPTRYAHEGHFDQQLWVLASTWTADFHLASCPLIGYCSRLISDTQLAQISFLPPLILPSGMKCRLD